jgi:hypothetical protein
MPAATLCGIAILSDDMRIFKMFTLLRVMPVTPILMKQPVMIV